MKKQDKVQTALILIGILLILVTYFYYPSLRKVNLDKKKETIQKNEEIKDENENATFFENVEYKGLYDLDKRFTVGSEKAYILNDKPNIVHMTDMHVILYLKDGRIVNIFSDQGRYNKETYDCFFEKNVNATDGETKIFAENLDLLSTKNIVEIYNNVILNNPTGSIVADKVDYNFETKYFKISMLDDEAVKLKVIE